MDCKTLVTVTLRGAWNSVTQPIEGALISITNFNQWQIHDDLRGVASIVKQPLKNVLNAVSGLDKWQIEDNEMYAKTIIEKLFKEKIIENTDMCDFLKELDKEEEQFQKSEGDDLCIIKNPEKINPKRKTKILVNYGLNGFMWGGMITFVAIASLFTGGALLVFFNTISSIFSGLGCGLVAMNASSKNKYSTVEIYDLRAIRLNKKAKKIAIEILKNKNDKSLLEKVRDVFIDKVNAYVNKYDRRVGAWDVDLPRTKMVSCTKNKEVFNYYTGRFETKDVDDFEWVEDKNSKPVELREDLTRPKELEEKYLARKDDLEKYTTLEDLMKKYENS